MTDTARRGSTAVDPAVVGRRVLSRWAPARPFLAVGCVSIVAGGVVAAVTRPAGFELGPWLAAFLVLVGGVAQIALGVGQAWIAADPPPPRDVRRELMAWNLAVVTTIVGSLAAVPVSSTLGGVAMVVALVMFLTGVRSTDVQVPRWAPVLYRSVVVVVLVSTPIGLVLAWLRHG